MTFMKEETALMFDVGKLKVGSIIMIHYSDSERYGMVDYVSPTNISIGREDGTSVSILSTDVYLDKENPVEGKVFLDVISPEEMYHIFDSRMAPSNRLGAHEMHKIIEECASEGSIVSKIFVKAYAEQTEDERKSFDEDLSTLWNVAEKNHDKAKKLWLRSKIRGSSVLWNPTLITALG